MLTYIDGLKAALKELEVELVSVDLEYADAPAARKAAHRVIKNCMVQLEALIEKGGEIG